MEYIEKLNKIKTQLNRIESLIKRLLEEQEQDVYIPTQAEKNEISSFASKAQKEARERWIDENNYIKFTHKNESKWQPITEEMMLYLTAIDMYLSVPDVTQEDRQFVKQMMGVTDGTDAQFKKINALVYKLYNS